MCGFNSKNTGVYGFTPSNNDCINFVISLNIVKVSRILFITYFHFWSCEPKKYKQKVSLKNPHNTSSSSFCSIYPALIPSNSLKESNSFLSYYYNLLKFFPLIYNILTRSPAVMKSFVSRGFRCSLWIALWYINSISYFEGDCYFFYICFYCWD